MDENESISNESPTISETEQEMIADQQESPSTEVDLLLAELEKAGVTTADQLKDKFIAGRETGNMANQLGEARRQIAELHELLRYREERATKEEPGYDDDSGVDVRRLLREEIEAHDARKAAAQVEAQKQIQAMWSGIQQDEDYHLVKDIWETKLKDPAFVFGIQQGQLNPVSEYTNTVRAYYKGMLKKTVDVMKKTYGKDQPSPPHVEQGTSTPSLPGNQPPIGGNDKINKMKDKVDKGGILTQEQELEALVAVLGGE